MGGAARARTVRRFARDERKRGRRESRRGNLEARPNLSTKSSSRPKPGSFNLLSQPPNPKPPRARNAAIGKGTGKGGRKRTGKGSR